MDDGEAEREREALSSPPSPWTFGSFIKCALPPRIPAAIPLPILSFCHGLNKRRRTLYIQDRITNTKRKPAARRKVSLRSRLLLGPSPLPSLFSKMNLKLIPSVASYSSALLPPSVCLPTSLPVAKLLSHNPIREAGLPDYRRTHERASDNDKPSDCAATAAEATAMSPLHAHYIVC